MSDVERFYAVAPIEMVDVRDSSSNDDNTWTMSGYAAVFGHKAEVFTSKFVHATVEIGKQAFSRVLSEQQFTQPTGVVHFNRGHDMNTSVAATDVPSGQPGSLQLSVDKNGLRFLAKVSRDDPDGIALASKMRAGVVRQASFAFTTSGDEWTVTENGDGPDEEHRLITEVQHLYDVCAAPQGLFPQTVSSLQRYATLLGQPDQGGHHRQPDLGGDNAVSPETEGHVDSERDQSPLVLATRRFMAAERERLGYVFAKEQKDDGGSDSDS
jgi:HK97 family phage prohead protease